MTTTTHRPHHDEGRPDAGRKPLAAQAWENLPQALAKLDPRHLVRQPVIFVVWIGSVLTTVLSVMSPSVFSISITLWLWATIIFANLAEAIAEGRGKAQAATLRQTRTTTTARRLRDDGTQELIPGSELRLGDRVVVEAGQVIPGDGDVVEGVATVDESAITGESAPVIRESGGDRCAVTGGTTVLSDRIVVQITSKPGETFIDRMIALVEGASRQKTPNEIALGILLTVLTLIFVLAVIALQPMAIYSGGRLPLVVLVALLVCLIPTTIGALLSAIGIAGMDRLVQRNVLAMSGRAVEAAGDVSTLLLDKTGTITFGNRRASDVLPVAGATREELLRAAYLSSLADETPEGRSIVDFALAEGVSSEVGSAADLLREGAQFVPFTAQTRMSGVDLDTGTRVRKGAGSAVARWVHDEGGHMAHDVDDRVDQISKAGGTPLVVAIQEPGAAPRQLGVVFLKDIVKPGMAQRFAQLRQMGIRTVMITGDNPLTAAAIAAEAGVDDFLAEATPEDKMALIKAEQEGGRLVAMTGDGTNDAPALAQADVGVAMNTGTSAAKEAGNMVDLDSDPTKLIDIVGIGKQLLITRGALTTFSIANDIAKYFAIIPAMFVTTFPGLSALNVMLLHSPQSAMLSAVIFNALVIVALIPLSLKGVAYRPLSAAALLRRNLFIYGLGGVVTPFLGIKAIDLFVSLLPRIVVTAMKRQLWAATRALLTFTVLLGIAYPVGLTALAQLMPGRATGSLVLIDGRPAGSTLLGQAVVDPQWFRGRPSVSDYTGETSGGSNWGPSAAQLSAELTQRSADLREANPLAPPGPIPADALTASASGLDPHISPAYARWQAPRVAAARGMTVEQVQRLIDANTTFGELGYLGADRVNVTTLNLALADLGR